VLIFLRLVIILGPSLLPADALVAGQPKPIVIFTQPCSQSSWVVWALQRLIAVAGRDFARGEVEALNPEKATNKPPYAAFRAGGGGDYASYLRHLRAAHAAAGALWVVKTFPGNLEARPELLKLVRDEWGVAPVINLHRSNALDRLVCEVRDCFAPASAGHAVNASTGQPSTACFARRTMRSSAGPKRKKGATGVSNEEVAPKAWLNLSSLAAEVAERSAERQRARLATLWPRGFDARHSFSADAELAAYQVIDTD